jgi:hypothetical protein
LDLGLDEEATTFHGKRPRDYRHVRRFGLSAQWIAVRQVRLQALIKPPEGSLSIYQEGRRSLVDFVREERRTHMSVG